jgi:hypothetical protein
LPAFAVVDVAPDEVLDELLDELPPQAVTSRQTAANDMSHLKRFIDTLRSRLRRRQLIGQTRQRGPARRDQSLRPFGKYLNKMTISSSLPGFNYE